MIRGSLLFLALLVATAASAAENSYPPDIQRIVDRNAIRSSPLSKVTRRQSQTRFGLVQTWITTSAHRATTRWHSQPVESEVVAPTGTLATGADRGDLCGDALASRRG